MRTTPYLPSTYFLKANRCPVPYQGLFFHCDFKHLEEKTFSSSYFININDDFVLGTVLGHMCVCVCIHTHTYIHAYTYIWFYI